jgi:hypothetical protein
MGRLGCLFSILIAITVAYFGANVGGVYLRSFRLRDGMQQEARFASQRDDNTIRTRLVALVDTLGLPPEAGRFRIQRFADRIVISTSYAEQVELPLFVRDFRFQPRVEQIY